LTRDCFIATAIFFAAIPAHAAARLQAQIRIALYPEDATTAGGLFGAADATMYLAKFARASSGLAGMPQTRGDFAAEDQASLVPDVRRPAYDSASRFPRSAN